jgi:hypothetical protein
MAPEIYIEMDYAGAVDVFSFALVLYELLVGEPVSLSHSRCASYCKGFKTGTIGHFQV